MKTEEMIRQKIKDLEENLAKVKQLCINMPADTVGGCLEATQYYESVRYATDIFNGALEWVLED